MWPGLKRFFGFKKPDETKLENCFRLSEEGIYFRAWLNLNEQLWPWDSVREFGLSVHQAIYPAPWFGDYMEAEWFFTVESGEGPRRFFFEVEHFSIQNLPKILDYKLAGFDRSALAQGWKEHLGGLRNYKGEGQWLAWRKEAFVWPTQQESD
jgi:hypothetical protein